MPAGGPGQGFLLNLLSRRAHDVPLPFGVKKETERTRKTARPAAGPESLGEHFPGFDCLKGRP
jgi:hypothetical protein